MKSVLAVPIIASILFLGTLGFSQDVFAPPPANPEKIQVGPIKAVLNVLSAQSDRLDAIDAVGSNPPDDTIPAAIGALDNIVFQCEGITDSANRMKGDFTRGTGEHSTVKFSLFSAIPSFQYAAAQVTPPDDGKPDPGLANKLSSIANVLSSMNQRLDKISAAGSNPPDDQIPEAIAALDGIIGECAHITDTANRMKGDFSRGTGGR